MYFTTFPTAHTPQQRAVSFAAEINKPILFACLRMSEPCGADPTPPFPEGRLQSYIGTALELELALPAFKEKTQDSCQARLIWFIIAPCGQQFKDRRAPRPFRFSFPSSSPWKCFNFWEANSFQLHMTDSFTNHSYNQYVLSSDCVKGSLLDEVQKRETDIVFYNNWC